MKCGLPLKRDVKKPNLYKRLGSNGVNSTFFLGPDYFFKNNKVLFEYRGDGHIQDNQDDIVNQIWKTKTECDIFGNDFFSIEIFEVFKKKYGVNNFQYLSLYNSVLWF